MLSLNKDIILLGPQGSGKGTQGRILSGKYNLPFFEMGAYFRKIVEVGDQNSKYTQDIANYLKSGRLVPDENIVVVLANFISQHSNTPIVFDGICRTLKQKEDFDFLMKKFNRDYIAVYIELSKEKVFDRLQGRRICPTCKTTYPASYTKEYCSFVFESGLECRSKLIKRRDDENAGAIEKRLNSFYEKTVPAINSFESEGKLLEIDGGGSIEDVANLIEKKIQKDKVNI